MSDKNYELYKKYRVDIFNTIWDSLMNYISDPTDEVIVNEKLKIHQHLKELGFDLKESN